MTWPDCISVYHKIREEPESSADSFTLDVMIVSEKHQRPAARCVEDIVFYDYKKGKKAALPSFAIEQFRQTFTLQEATRLRSLQKAQGLEERVRTLEQTSWDRVDAKEDFGSQT